MTPVILDAATLYCGNSLEVLPAIAANSVDAVVCDPPYELGFMGKAWDSSGIANNPALWDQVLRVLKPGGHLLAFSGSRTYHRMTCAIEDAGFEVRDQIMWIYGQGFPKSHNGPWGGTALKPSHEPICVARKPLDGTVEANWLLHGTGALNIDACRIGTEEVLRFGAGGIPCRHDESVPRGRDGQSSAECRYITEGGTDFAALPGPRGGSPEGRWPANVIHDGSEEVVALFPENTGQSGVLKTRNSDKTRNTFGAFVGTESAHFEVHDGKGSAARFFYCAKTSKRDRNAGCEALPQKVGGMVSNTSGQHITRRDDGYVPAPQRNDHPTVKPTDLMAYLVRLVTPMGGVVLDPFMGSGSTGKACMREGFRFIGIDMTPEYVEIAKARIEHEAAIVSEAARLSAIPAPQFDLFAEPTEVA
jgi:DNA modification methylase